MRKNLLIIIFSWRTYSLRRLRLHNIKITIFAILFKRGKRLLCFIHFLFIGPVNYIVARMYL